MKPTEKCCPPIYVVSGGVGASGEQLARTALAQFEHTDMQIIIVPHVRQVEQIEAVVEQAASTGGTIIHTLVDVDLRQAMIRLTRNKNIVAIDPIGRLLSHLANVSGQEPRGQPGLYRELRQAYFDRVEAIEFTMKHDDGLKPDEWSQAEIVLVGVSRTGKTPLSMYLAVRGWKVANVPLVRNVPPSPKLLQLDRRRVVGLLIDPGQLLSHRQQRQRRLGVPGNSAYTDPNELYEEIEAARHLYRHNGFAIVDVTDKPIEESADEVLALMNRRLKTPLQ
ncbi:MAG: kinase/pyrophosphorylase [Anaerolineae bacterium]|nr:kinase/pyrophosphorylase [Anaerolineae bacterium]